MELVNSAGAGPGPSTMWSRERRAAKPASAEASEQLRLRRREIIRDIAARLDSGADPDTEVLPALYRALEAERIVDASLGFVVTDNGDGMQLAFSKGFEQPLIEKCVRLDFGQGICGTMAVIRQPMHVTNIQRSLDPMADLVRSAGINAYAGEPLIVDGKLLGTLSFASRTRSRFDAEDLLFFREVAKLVTRARARSRKDAKDLATA